MHFIPSASCAFTLCVYDIVYMLEFVANSSNKKCTLVLCSKLFPIPPQFALFFLRCEKCQLKRHEHTMRAARMNALD